MQSLPEQATNARDGGDSTTGVDAVETVCKNRDQHVKSMDHSDACQEHENHDATPVRETRRTGGTAFTIAAISEAVQRAIHAEVHGEKQAKRDGKTEKQAKRKKQQAQTRPPAQEVTSHPVPISAT